MVEVRIKQAKEGFFDRKPVIDALGPARAKVLGKGAGLIHKIAQRSMRPGSKRLSRKIQQTLEALAHARGAERERLRGDLQSLQQQASAPKGQPPRYWLKLLRKLLFYSWDSNTRSVVIGPTLINGAGEHVPETLEKGGTETVTRGRRHKVKRRIKIQPHPYMGPALEKARPELSGMWADSVKA